MKVLSSPLHRLAFLMIMVLSSFFMSGQTFSYTPMCVNSPNQLPQLSPGFPPGGSFISSPGGLNLLISNGQINPSMSTPGTYTVTYLVPGCPSCNVKTVVNIHALTPLSIDNASICANSGAFNLVVVANPSTGLTYTWSPLLGNTPTLNISPPSAISLTLMATDVNGCVSQAVKQVSIVSGPNVTIAGNGTVCPGASVILIAQGATNYTWSNGSNAGSINVSPTTNTTYTVTGTTSLNGSCPGRAVKTVVVNNLTVTANSPTSCAGVPVSLVASSNATGPVNYFWYPGAQSGQSIMVSPTTTQLYTVQANSGNCTASFVTKVTASPSFTPITGFTYKYPLCTNFADQSPTLVPGFVHGGSFSSNIALDINDTTGLVNFSTIAPGDYVISYNLAAVGCTAASTGTALLSVGLAGQIDFIKDIVIVKGSSAQLWASGGTFYSWSPNEFITCTDCDTPRVSPPESMQYCVVSDQCLDGGCVNVTVLCNNLGDLSVPNAFTPNGDGNNDKFCLQGWNDCNTEFEILIFDRWGEKVFQSDNASFCWDGKANGQPVPAGVYTYVITARFETVPRVSKNGNITVMR